MEEPLRVAGVLVLAKASLGKLARLMVPVEDHCRPRRLLGSMVNLIEEVGVGVVFFVVEVCGVVIAFAGLDGRCSMLEQ